MNKMYLVRGRVSETPVYWTAHYSDRIVNQIDDNGKIVEKWSTLDTNDLEFWGIVSNVGYFGYYPKQNICDLNGEKIQITNTDTKTLHYKRTIVTSSEGWTRVKKAEISYGESTIILNLLPETKIVLLSSNN